MTALARKPSPAMDPFQEDFAANASRLPGAGLAWLDARRKDAMAAFAATGIPGRRVEAWKFTDLASALDEGLASGGAFHGRLRAENADGIEIADLAALDAKTPANTPEWVREHLGTLATGPDQPMGALSLALMRGGVAVRARKSATLHLDFAEAAAASHGRVLIVVEPNVLLRLLETHAGEGGKLSLANTGMELVLKPGAKLEHIRVQAGAPSALDIVSLGANIARDAEYHMLCVAAGARLSRVDAHIKLAEQGASATVNNIAVLGSGIADTTTVMEHASPHTTSRQLFKSVVGGRGRAVAQGRVRVNEGAVKSDSHQLFKALLLSPRAEADAKPELEIYADDVICGHGTAIGALEEDALFYLRARGIPETEARGLLVRAFLDEAAEGFGDEAVRDALWLKLDAALAALEGAEA